MGYFARNAGTRSASRPEPFILEWSGPVLGYSNWIYRLMLPWSCLLDKGFTVFHKPGRKGMGGNYHRYTESSGRSHESCPNNQHRNARVSALLWTSVRFGAPASL